MQQAAKGCTEGALARTDARSDHAVLDFFSFFFVSRQKRRTGQYFKTATTKTYIIHKHISHTLTTTKRFSQIFSNHKISQKMRSTTKSLYDASMVILYMVCRFGWTLYSKYQERFATLSEDYTKEYGEEQLALVNQAQALLDVSQRRGTVTQQGNELDGSSLAAILFWKKLRRYILKAFVGADPQAAIVQAGGAHFAKARNGSWTEITELLTAGQTYLQANAALLTEKGKMPAGFPADYSKAKDAYDKEHIGYGSAKSNAADGTTDKVEANNTLYTNLQFMFGDAQTVFDNQKPVAKQFTFAAVKRLVTKGMSGIHFTVINPLTKKPLPEALITTDESAEVYEVNARGVATILMKAGVHSITVSCPGFSTYTGLVKADAGIKHRVKIELIKQPVSHDAPEVTFNRETALEQ